MGSGRLAPVRRKGAWVSAPAAPNRGGATEVLFSVPLRGHQELRVESDGTSVELFVRSLYGEDGMTAGALRLHVADLKMVGHVLRYVLHQAEVAEWRRSQPGEAA